MNGGFKRKCSVSWVKHFRNIEVPEKLKGREWIIGTEQDSRDKWRERLDNHTKNAEYEITHVKVES